MNILFVHQNFPGQFLHLAEALKARGHTCMALTSATNERKINLPHARYRFTPPDVKGIARTHVKHLARAEAVAKAADSLRKKHNVMPDVIFSHTGWGEGLLLREVWPDAKHLAYAEFCYRPRGLDVGFDPEFGRSSLDTRLRTVAMQAYLMQGVLEADSALSPTQWQAESFPEKLRRDITVCHDGIDTDRASPKPDARFRLANGRVLGLDDEVLTFVNRNLEPYRGFHIFMRALPEVLRARPNAQVVIVGGASGVDTGLCQRMDEAGKT